MEMSMPGLGSPFTKRVFMLEFSQIWRKFNYTRNGNNLEFGSRKMNYKPSTIKNTSTFKKF